MILSPIDSCGVIFTYECSCACKHCLYACGPKWDGWMNERDLDAIYAGIKGVWGERNTQPRPGPLFQGVHLAGGEATIKFDFLVNAVRQARELGLYLDYVETNAAWCVSASDVKKKFEALREAGLERVLVSCSPWHAEKVPLKNTLLAAEVARQIFGPQGVIVYIREFVDLIAEFGTDKPVPLKRWTDKYGEQRAGTIFWEGYGLIPGGRSGYHLGHLVPARKAESFAGQDCGSELMLSRHAHFDLYRNYVPGFCGGISLGKIEELPRFYEEFNIRKVPLVKLLVEKGSYGLMEMGKREFGYEELEGYAGKCHLCVDVRRHIAGHTDEFKELEPRRFYDML